MVTIRLSTWIDAPVERCYKLATSVDFHIASAKPKKEKATGDLTTGLIAEGQQVTWTGWHYGLHLKHTTRMDVSRPFAYFREVMISGVFTFYEHEHHFAAMDDGTRVRDEVRFKAPLGPVGRVMEKVVLRRYLISLLKRRSAALKRAAESDGWHEYLDGMTERTTVVPHPRKFMTLEREMQR